MPAYATGRPAPHGVWWNGPRGKNGGGIVDRDEVFVQQDFHGSPPNKTTTETLCKMGTLEVKSRGVIREEVEAFGAAGRAASK
jgi:hypothetical protein